MVKVVQSHDVVCVCIYEGSYKAKEHFTISFTLKRNDFGVLYLQENTPNKTIHDTPPL